MRKWNDKGAIPLKHQKIYAFCIVITFGIAGIQYLTRGFLSIENIIGLALAVFLIYGIWFGGMYKIMRWYAERKASKFDNDWSPHWTK